MTASAGPTTVDPVETVTVAPVGAPVGAPPAAPDDAPAGPRAVTGRTLAHVAAERDARRAALDTAENDYASAHAAALEGGWTAAELKKVGLGEPDARAVRRLRRRADAGGAA